VQVEEAAASARWATAAGGSAGAVAGYEGVHWGGFGGGGRWQCAIVVPI